MSDELTIAAQRPLAPARWAPLVLGLMLVAVLTAFDIAHGSSIIISTVVLGPFVTSRLGTTRQTVIVAAFASVCDLSSVLWNDNAIDSAYVLRTVVVVSGGLVAIIAARERTQNETAVRRFAVLAAVAEVTNARRSLAEVVELIGDLIVPAVADYFVCDLVVNEEAHRLHVKMVGPDTAELTTYMSARAPSPLTTGLGSAAVAIDRRAQLSHMTDEIFEAVSYGAEDLKQLRRLDTRSLLTVPLYARDKVVGALTLAVRNFSGRRFTPDDLAFIEVLSGRVALALDNAGLNSDLREAERQLGTVLGQLDEAVMITTANGALSYVNEAALKLLGVADRAELGAARAEDVLNRMSFTREVDGAPVPFDDLPWGAATRGKALPEPAIVRGTSKTSGQEIWLRIKASPIVDDARDVAQVVTVIEDVTQLKQAELRAQILADASATLAATADYEQALQRVIDAAVPAVGVWGAVGLTDTWGPFRLVGVAHSDAALLSSARTLATRSGEGGLIARVVHDGARQQREDVDGTMLAVPLIASGSVLGAIAFGGPPGHQFSDEDVELVSELARRAAGAIETTRLSLERAMTNEALQRGLRPAELSTVPGWASAAMYQPAGARSDVGGDFYDLFETPTGWIAVMGDITGHGALAARLTAVSRFALRAVAEHTGDLLTAIDRLNRMLLDEPDLSLVTLACVRLGPTADDGTARADVVRCGHPAPMIVGLDGVREVGSTHPMLGALPSARWEVTEVTLRPGDTLVLYTDGVTDVTGRTERFGTDRLTQTLAVAPLTPDEIVSAVRRALEHFRDGPQRDDEALLALQLAPSDVPSYR